MQSARVDLITVSREFGAGGSDLARLLGERLGWLVLDHELVFRCAKRLNIDTAAVERMHECPPSLLARLSAALLVSPPDAPGIDTSHLLRIDSIAEAAHESIREAADNPPLIVVGHGTQCLFAQRRDALHVRLFAPLDVRVTRLRDRYGWTAAVASAKARQMDDDRRRYVQRYFHQDLREPLLYDVQINTGRVSIEEAVNMVEQMVHETSTSGTAATREQGAGATA
jgi:cytidylate kinase